MIFFSYFQVLVLDEADRLLDMGFLPSIKRILASLPPPAKRQTLLYTATVPEGAWRYIMGHESTVLT